MDKKSRIDRAIESGLAFLAVTQTAEGEIPIFTCERRDMDGHLHPDPCISPTALAGYALGFRAGRSAGTRTRHPFPCRSAQPDGDEAAARH